MDNPPTFILDTFALLAYLRDEPAASRIEKLLKDAKQGKYRLYLSIINLGELLYITERRGATEKAQVALALLRQLPVEILPADEQTVFAAAHVKANYAISYADAFAIAAAQHMGGTVITGDPEFNAVEEIVQVEWLPAAE
ncbi:MAG: type II toxin-antitoxin system VapC family toxin [Anaerolineales bacterium]|nr:MAG: type II toxin-antitoxin system VapC family toxin [Anaerolineales bacterium]